MIGTPDQNCGDGLTAKHAETAETILELVVQLFLISAIAAFSAVK